MILPSENTTAVEFAIKLLHRRNYFVDELRTAVRQQGYDEATIDKVLQEPLILCVLDDEKIVARFLERDLSKQELKDRLLSRGVNGDTCAHLIEMCTYEHQEAAIDRIMEQRCCARKSGAAIDNSSVAKAYRYLLRRGFDVDMVISACERYMQQGDCV